MNEAAEKAMNNFRIYEARVLYAQCGYVSITGNGQLTSIVPENEAEDAERLRCMNGY